MADTKISGLTQTTAPLPTDLFAIDSSGTSKSISLAQVRGASAVPVVISVGAEFTSTGAPTATLPGTHATNDILVLVLQSSNQSLATPAGYTQLGPQNGIGVAVAAGANRPGIFWKRDGGAESAPTIADSGDHTYGFMFAIRGCPTTNDPFVFGGNNWKFTTSTSASGPKSVTSTDNTLVVDIFAGSADNASAEGSGLTNADLASLTENFDDGTTDGTGGFLYMASGSKATAGPVGATTVTWANTSVDLCTRIHFIPSDTVADGLASRALQIQSFIGSPSDTDDTWVKPTGARRVFVQVIDGGGSGSGGNTTTTAEGGGGGGGGGYDEGWYDADNLGATVSLHAGKGGAVGTALNQAGNAGVVSEFNKGGVGPLTSTAGRTTGTAATAAASADGGNGGCGSGLGTPIAVQTTRVDVFGTTTSGRPVFKQGGAGGSGTTANTGGGNADWGGGGGESGADTDAALTGATNGWSTRGAGGGGGGRTNTNIPIGGFGGGATSGATQGAKGGDSTILGYGGGGGVGGGSSVVTGGTGGFPGGGGGGGAGVAGGFGGKGGDGIVVVTTYF